MTEQPHHPEKQTTRETREHIRSPERSKEELHEEARRAEQAERAEQQRHNIEQLKTRAEKEAKGREETRAEHQETRPEQPVLGMQRELKAQAYQTTMQKVRSQLSPTGRVFSKFIHQPAIDAISEFSAKTIARPSAILGGGFAALLGSGFVLFMAKYYGFRYNFFVYIGFMVGGFLVGLIAELILRSVRQKS